MAQTEWLLGMAKAEFGDRSIAEITPPQILKCHRKVEAKGKYETAHRLRANIGAVFRYTIANGAADTDPIYALHNALNRPAVTSRAAITEPPAPVGLLRAIDRFKGQPTTRIALRLLAILTQRPGELRHTTWEEFDLRNVVWSIPAGRMKMRRAHRVPLPEAALELLRKL